MPTGIKKCLIIVSSIIIIIMFIISFLKLRSYYIIYKDTDSLVSDFRDVICDTKKPGIDYGELMIYDHTQRFPIYETKNVNVDRRYVNHNFKEGYMEVVDSYEINPNDPENTSGANCEAIWHIKKMNGRWKVYAIYERMGAAMVRMGSVNG